MMNLNAGRFIGIVFIILGIIFATTGIVSLEEGEKFRKIFFISPSVFLVGLSLLILGSGNISVREYFKRIKNNVPLNVFENIPRLHSIIYCLAVIIGVGISLLYIIYFN